MPALIHPKRRSVVRIGFFYRKSDRSYVRRYRCKNCLRSFSSATRKPEYRQKKRHLNERLRLYSLSGVSQRRLSFTENLNRKTVVRKLRFLAAQAKREHRVWQKEAEKNPRVEIQFDDLETAEHTKCKPISVALAVDPVSRKILSYQVSRMPAKGHLAAIARRKYPYRPDERRLGWDRLMRELKPMVTPNVTFVSDQNPHYPQWVFKHHKRAKHETHEGKRGCIAGQGELKKIGFDPLFSLNHSCAMLRANLNRLFRRTWCITKNLKGLEDHLALYVTFHNRTLTEKVRGRYDRSTLYTAYGGSL